MSGYTRLLARYAALASKSAEYGRHDRSLRYFQLDKLADAGIALGGTERASTWIRRVRRLDRFIDRNHHLPRENSGDAEERALADWLRYQRRPATRDRHCDYQRERLEALPGFAWDPKADAWHETLAAYSRFIHAHSRAPRYRSSDSHERALASWAAKQRQAVKRDRLTAEQVRRLSELPISVTARR